MGGKDKRIAKRVETELFISFYVLNDMGSPQAGSMGLALNISRTGVMLENRNEIAKNSRLSLELAVGDDTIQVKGLVKYSKKADDVFHIGIELIDLTEEELALIGKYYPDVEE
jgi:hypothetical protein